MKTNRLWRFHVGRMPGPARWYLAALGLASLLLLSGHFAVQEHVQKRMRTVVHGWLSDAGGSVAHVRFRLLRGELTLVGLHLRRPDWQLDAPLAVVRTSSSAMRGGPMHLAALRLEHVSLRVSSRMLQSRIPGHPSFRPWVRHGDMPHFARIRIADMDVHVYNDADKTVPPIILSRLRGEWREGELALAAALGGGMLRMHGRAGDSGVFSGSLQAKDVPLRSLMALGGLSYRRASTLNGLLHVSGDERTGDVSVQGSADIRQADSRATVVFDGRVAKHAVDWHLHCTRFNPAGFSRQLPSVAGRRLSNGLFDGEVRLHKAADAAGWRLALDGTMHDLLLQAPDLPDWRMRQVALAGLRMSSGGDGFSAQRVEIDGARLGMNAFPTARKLTQPENKTIGALIERLALRDVRARLWFADGASLELPPMRGRGRIHGEKSVLHAATQPPAAENLRPNDAASGQWSVQAAGDFTGAFQARVSAVRVPLTRLRPLLPHLALPGAEGDAEYGGYADAELTVRVAPNGLRASGEARLHDMTLTQGGDSFRAGQVAVRIDSADSDGERKLAEVAVRDWLYQAAIHPLTAAASRTAMSENNETDASGPIAEAMLPEIHAPDWRIGHLLAEGGRISLGRTDAVVARNIRLSARHLRRGARAPFRLSGVVGDGDLRMQGRIALQPSVHVSGVMQITDMLPFVFNDWLHVSAMPRFVRGRMNARMQINKAGKRTGAYRVATDILLRRGELEAGSFPDDPLIGRGGYALQALFDRLNRKDAVHLAFAFDGDRQGEGLPADIGRALLRAMNKAAGHALATYSGAAPKPVAVTRIRLQGRHGFSHNERVRLRRMIRRLQKQPGLVVDLVPQLAAAIVDDALRARVRHSQHMIEGYMRKFGIARRRIFPVWPLAAQHRSDAPGIILRAYAL